MEINYNITGEKRKSLVNAISQKLNTPAKYLGAPTFAYEVGGYLIDKNCKLTGPDNLDLEADLQGIHGFAASERREDSGGENGMQASDVPEPDEAYNLIIEMPKSAFTDTTLENLKRLVASKSSLIKKALGITETPLEVMDETIRFPWFTDVTDSETVKAYTHFVAALCEMAKTQRRISAAYKPVENEKYAFRCFLLRLGFIGEEYKVERKIMLSKLKGSSAFKNPTAGGADNE